MTSKGTRDGEGGSGRKVPPGYAPPTEVSFFKGASVGRTGPGKAAEEARAALRTRPRLARDADVIPFPGAPRSAAPWRVLSSRLGSLRPLAFDATFLAATPHGIQAITVRASEHRSGALRADLSYGPALRRLDWSDDGLSLSWDGDLHGDLSDLRHGCRATSVVLLPMHALSWLQGLAPTATGRGVDDLVSRAAATILREGAPVPSKAKARPSAPRAGWSCAVPPKAASGEDAAWKVCRSDDGSLILRVPMAPGERRQALVCVQPLEPEWTEDGAWDGATGLALFEISPADPLLAGPFDPLSGTVRALPAQALSNAFGIRRLAAWDAAVRSWSGLWDVDPSAAAQAAARVVEREIVLACASSVSPSAKAGMDDVELVAAGALLATAGDGVGLVQVWPERIQSSGLAVPQETCGVVGEILARAGYEPGRWIGFLDDLVDPTAALDPTGPEGGIPDLENTFDDLLGWGEGRTFGSPAASERHGGADPCEGVMPDVVALPLVIDLSDAPDAFSEERRVEARIAFARWLAETSGGLARRR